MIMIMIMIFQPGDYFWTETIESPYTKRKIVYGKVLHFSVPRQKYIVEWCNNTPKIWILWTNNKMNEKQMYKVKN